MSAFCTEGLLMELNTICLFQYTKCQIFIKLYKKQLFFLVWREGNCNAKGQCTYHECVSGRKGMECEVPHYCTPHSPVFAL